MSKIAKRPESVRVSLPITPFLDMSFQLMFFFVLTFRPSAQEGQILIYMPRLPSEYACRLPPPPPPTGEVEAPQKEITLRVSTANGEIATITFVDSAGATDVGQLPSDLYKKLKGIPTIDGVMKPKIKIEAMSDLRYGRLVQLMDVCIKAGFDTVGVTPSSANGT